MERNNAWLRELIGRLSMARVISVSHPPLKLKREQAVRLNVSAHWAKQTLRLHATTSEIDRERTWVTAAGLTEA
jgi:hypothetical protein